MIVTLHGKSDKTHVSLILNEEEFNIVSHAVRLLSYAAVGAETDETKKASIEEMVKTLSKLS